MDSITPKNCSVSVKKAIQQLKTAIRFSAEPTFAEVTITGLTASSLVGTNASKLLESITIGSSLTYTRPTLDTIQDIQTTASPIFAGLHINSAEVVSTTLLTLESDISNNTEYNEILFKIAGGVNYGAIRSCVGAAANDSYMSFFTTTDGGTLVQQVTIQHDGKVGFGKFPSQKLDIVAGNSGVLISDTGEGRGVAKSLFFGDGGGTWTPIMWGVAGASGDAGLHFLAETEVADDSGIEPLIRLNARQIDSTPITTRPILAIENDRNQLVTVDKDGNVDITGTVTGTSFITAGNIGVVADTDLLQLAANTLTVNGTITLPSANKINFRDSDISIGSPFDGKLDINADVSVGFFYDNADVGDEVDGQSVYINRRAGEGDDYIRLYVDKNRKGLIGFSGADDLLQLSTTGLTVNNSLFLGEKVTSGSFASPTDVTNIRQYGLELHYSGDDYDVTGIRSRAQLVTTDTAAQAQGGLFQAANNNGIDAGVLNGIVSEAIGKSDSISATITTMRGGLSGAEWGPKDTVTNLFGHHIRVHSLNATGEGSFGTGYGLYIENEAVGGNGQALDAGIYFKGTNLSAGNKAFTYGIDFSGGTFATADIKLSNGSVINDMNNRWGINVLSPTVPLDIAQTEDAKGLKISGFDDQSAQSYEIRIRSNGRTDVRSSGTLQTYVGGILVTDSTSTNTNFRQNFRVYRNLQWGSSANFSSVYDSINDKLSFAYEGDALINPFLVIDSSGNGGWHEESPETLTEWTHAAPYLTIHNSTHEDTDGGGESKLIFKREDGAGTETACFQFEASHDGAVANDQLGKGVWSINTGAGLVPALEIQSTTDWVINKTSGVGIKVDLAAPTFGWRDLKGKITNSKGATKPSEITYRDGITQFQFSDGDDAGLEFHIPHDYVPGTDIHLHVHWSHNSGAVTGGNIVLTYEISYAKGHDRGTFPATVTGTITGTASATQYRHIVSEGQISAGTPEAGVQIDSDDLEPDGLVLCRIEMTTNNMTGATPDPFIHEVDIHYQSTNIGTKQKAPDFYT